MYMYIGHTPLAGWVYVGHKTHNHTVPVYTVCVVACGGGVVAMARLLCVVVRVLFEVASVIKSSSPSCALKGTMSLHTDSLATRL